MAHAYTPGLRVSERAVIRKERRLPIRGEVIVEQGAQVKAGDIVARADLPGDVATVNVVNLLGITAPELPRFMLKAEGEQVAAQEAIAETRPWIKWLKSVARSPVAGTIETVSSVTGQVLIRMAPRPVELTAYLDGHVKWSSTCKDDAGIDPNVYADNDDINDQDDSNIDFGGAGGGTP